MYKQYVEKCEYNIYSDHRYVDLGCDTMHWTILGDKT